jgi:hypothetical protein
MAALGVGFYTLDFRSSRALIKLNIDLFKGESYGELNSEIEQG